ncbi:hypothetical protein GJAV_G00249810 [Gymnothorax javanicus]|nr:hypothetical protein GJAV_G00249810 [Gymnothorax javanicus]
MGSSPSIGGPYGLGQNTLQVALIRTREEKKRAPCPSAPERSPFFCAGRRECRGVVVERDSGNWSSGSGAGRSRGNGGEALNTEWEMEGLQTVAIVLIVCASVKLLHLLGVITFSEDNVDDELEQSMVRHRPEALEHLEAETKFTKKELQILYRGFKNDFVMGLSILLRGSVHEKLNWAFNLYDINKDGYITKEVWRYHQMTLR